MGRSGCQARGMVGVLTKRSYGQRIRKWGIQDECLWIWRILCSLYPMMRDICACGFEGSYVRCIQWGGIFGPVDLKDLVFIVSNDEGYLCLWIWRILCSLYPMMRDICACGFEGSYVHCILWWGIFVPVDLKDIMFIVSNDEGYLCLWIWRILCSWYPMMRDICAYGFEVSYVHCIQWWGIFLPADLKDLMFIVSNDEGYLCLWIWSILCSLYPMMGDIFACGFEGSYVYCIQWWGIFVPMDLKDLMFIVFNDKGYLCLWSWRILCLLYPMMRDICAYGFERSYVHCIQWWGMFVRVDSKDLMFIVSTDEGYLRLWIWSFVELKTQMVNF